MNQLGEHSGKEIGLGLVEIMVAVSLGLMILASLGYVLTGSRAVYRTQDASARLQDTGRFAMEMIGRQIRMAGWVDITPLASDARVDPPGSATGWMPITGTNDSNKSGIRPTDTLALQYQATNMNHNDIRDCNNNGKNELELSSLQSVDGAASNCGSSGKDDCKYGTVKNTISLDAIGLQLQCTGNGATGGAATQPFTEGVEDLQFLYAETGSPGVFNATPTDFSKVVAVEVCIMVQSLAYGVVSTPQKLFDCSGNVYAPNDTRLRRTFTSVFALRSRMP